MTGMTQVMVSSRIEDQMTRFFSRDDRNAKKLSSTSVRVFCISRRREAAPARSETRVSRSRQSSSRVVLSDSRYAFFLALVFLACSLFRRRLARARSSSVI